MNTLLRHFCPAIMTKLHEKRRVRAIWKCCSFILRTRCRVYVTVLVSYKKNTAQNVSKFCVLKLAVSFFQLLVKKVDYVFETHTTSFKWKGRQMVNVVSLFCYLDQENFILIFTHRVSFRFWSHISLYILREEGRHLTILQRKRGW
jgi:hypothetical protein